MRNVRHRYQRSTPTHSILTSSGSNYSSTDPGNKTVTTQSAPSAFPSALRLKKSAVQSLATEDIQTEAEIKQICPECGREKMWFYTLQLRSADEGATVFYRCECGYR